MARRVQIGKILMCKLLCIVLVLVCLIMTMFLLYRMIMQKMLYCSPEALGIVPGAIFLICLMFCLVGFATNHPHKVSEFGCNQQVCCNYC